jgi:hypothetical protein
VGVKTGASEGRGIGREYEIVSVDAATEVETWPDAQTEAGVITLDSVQGRAQAVRMRISPLINDRFGSIE